MVVLSIGVLTKSGRILLARQFVPISRQRIESLYNSFPKLLNTDVQHTFIETEQVRYVYQLIDDLYGIIITNKNSNIMEDLDTLQLISKLVPEYCGSTNENDVAYNSFELCSAFDELISIGYRESVTLNQIHTFTEMDSHEEKLQKIIQESKINEAREQMKQRADNIERKKLEEKKFNSQLSNDMSYGSSSTRNNKKSFNSSSTYNNDTINTQPTYNNDTISPAANAHKPAVKHGAAVKGKGMSLSKSKKTTDEFLSTLAKEDSSISNIPIQLNTTNDANNIVDNKQTNQSAASALIQGEDAVSIIIDEKCIIELERDMTLKKMELKGEMKLQIYDPKYSHIIVHTNGMLRDSDGYKCRLHPKINKSAWSDSHELSLTDTSKSFPVGSDNALAVCKWRKQYIDDTSVPISFNIWPTTENGQSVMSCEYTMDHDELVLNNVHVNIPCRTQPNVSSCSGEWKYNKAHNILQWSIGIIDQNTNSGTIEFSVSECDSDTFYPINIEFNSTTSFSGIDITNVTTVNDNQDVKFVPHISFTPETYVID